MPYDVPGQSLENTFQTESNVSRMLETFQLLEPEMRQKFLHGSAAGNTLNDQENSSEPLTIRL